MAPSRPAKLDLSSTATNASEGNANSNPAPSSVTFVVSGTAGVARVDALAQSWKEKGFLGDSKITLRALAYESDPNTDSIDTTPDQFKAASTAPTNLPITVIQPLPVKVATEKLPPQLPSPRAPAHTSLNFSLPTINSSNDIKANQQAWLDLLQQADERRYTVEFALRSPSSSSDKDEDADAIRAAVEELLGMAHAEAAKREQSPTEPSGGFFVFDAFASPPLHLASSQLLRSQELADWAGFISRLALHPRTYIKLSPLSISKTTANPRAADALTSTAVPSLATTTAQAAKETAANALSGLSKTVSSAVSSADDDASELKRRLRIFLDVILEAFGLERIIWSANLSAAQALAGDATSDGVVNAISGSADEQAVKEWYSAVLESLTSMGLDGKSVEGIFSHNASLVYRL